MKLVRQSPDETNGVKHVLQFYDEYVSSPNYLKHVAVEMKNLVARIEQVTADVNTWYWSQTG